MGAFITAQLEGNEVVYSVVLTKAKKPLSREDVESHFKGELSKKQSYSFGTLPAEVTPFLAHGGATLWLKKETFKSCSRTSGLPLQGTE
jgi:hypothetical protein